MVPVPEQPENNATKQMDQLIQSSTDYTYMPQTHLRFCGHPASDVVKNFFAMHFLSLTRAICEAGVTYRILTRAQILYIYYVCNAAL